MILKDLITEILDAVDDSKIADFSSKTSPSIKSITRANKDLIMTFPVMVSSSVDPQSAQLVGRALERKFVTLTQMLLSAISITSSKDAMDHLKNVHANLDTSSFFDVDDYLAVDNIEESVYTDPIEVNRVYESHYRNLYLSTPANHLHEVSRRPNTNPLVKVNDTDYKKANELQPTILQIDFISTGPDGKSKPINTSAYVGVKSKLYPVDSNDIYNHIISKRSYNFSLYNLIKATSGEIEFWRDFVFAIKKAKIDAISNTNRGSSSKLWKVLERRAIASKINRLLSMRNDATAITTLVISSYDAEYIRKTEDIDLADSRVARKLMDDYNLIGIVIVDDATESAKFIFDTGDDEYEIYTFKSLKRDEKLDYKQMIQLLAGGGR